MAATKRIEPRKRILMLARVLIEQTDENHVISLTSLFRQFEKEGLAAERKCIYRDMQALRNAGLDVQFRPGTNGGWYLASRRFDMTDLKALADAVGVYRWITQEKRESLLYKLSQLGSVHQREGLDRPVTLRWYGDVQPDEVRDNLDRIHIAIKSGRAISFTCYTYDSYGEQEAEDTRYIATPKGLLWADEHYHLLAWEHKEKRFRLYRVDRIGQLVVMGIPAQGEQADPAVWASAPFGLEPMRRESVQLYCRKSLAGEVMDRFGPSVTYHPMGDGFTINVDVVIGPAFWGWLWSHSDDIEVLAPDWVKRKEV